MVVVAPLGEGEGVALGTQEGTAGPPAAALLVGHPDGAIEDGVGVAVARVEEVVDLAGEEEPTVGVEDAGVAAADLGLEAALVVGDVGVEGLGGRGEVVAVLRAHLVEVGVDVGLPPLVEPEALLGLYLRGPGPVAVEVEQVVVGPPPGPGFDVVPGARRGLEGGGLAAADAVGVAGVAVGVEARVEDDDGIAQEGRERVAGNVAVGEGRGGGGEVVEHLRTRLRAGHLIAVDREGQPDDG